MEMFPRDAAVMYKWLRDQVVAKPGFFYDIEIDEERRIKTIFRMDAIIISDYSKFGDFVSFDTIYRMNDTHKPLDMSIRSPNLSSKGSECSILVLMGSLAFLHIQLSEAMIFCIGEGCIHRWQNNHLVERAT
ncbi:hypothetical protein LIER_38147 [Lithospermum erythrorhizon]|uniref:Uncharacterized protein n=1 Tax=Lithospermum erythrorhizon TaxID=34254 RepID=A0AAV3PWY5_LITER